MTATRKVRINPAKYGQLLAETLPRPIETEADYERAIAIIDGLIKKPEEKLTPEEHLLLELVSQLVERYEDKHYPIPAAPPHVMIRQFLLDRDLLQTDLAPVIGSRSRVSELLRGRRLPSKTQRQKLGEFFGVSPDLFRADEELK